MHDVLGRFFQAVLVASLLTLVSGVWMLGRVAKQVVQSGGSFAMPLSWTLMAVLGIAMVAIFMHIRFVLYKKLGQAVAASQWGRRWRDPGKDPHLGRDQPRPGNRGAARDTDALDGLTQVSQAWGLPKVGRPHGTHSRNQSPAGLPRHGLTGSTVSPVLWPQNLV